MFHIISKIISFLGTPLTWIVIFFLFSLITKNQKRKKRAFITGMVFLLFFTNSFIADEAMRLWEMPTTKYENVSPAYDYGIVLGGMASFDATNNRFNPNRSIDRLLQSVKLYKEGKIKKIFIVGGCGDILCDEKTESEFLKEYLITIGLPDSAIMIETLSKNTRQNALNAKSLLEKNDSSTKRLLLITSAVHMRRSLACFKKAGLSPDPFVADRYTGPRKYYFDHLFIPDLGALLAWEALNHELIGYITYYIMGYI